jgi:hypothetical protein
MRLILTFLTEISIIEGNPQTLPQIKIDDVEADLSQSARLIIICRLGTCVRSTYIYIYGWMPRLSFEQLTNPV